VGRVAAPGSGRRGYLVAMVVALVLALGGIVFLAVQSDAPDHGDMPEMDMDMDMDM
jgi:hypothetical protein